MHLTFLSRMVVVLVGVKVLTGLTKGEHAFPLRLFSEGV